MTEISFHVSSSAVIRSKLFKAGFVLFLGEPTLFKATKLSQAVSKTGMLFSDQIEAFQSWFCFLSW